MDFLLDVVFFRQSGECALDSWARDRAVSETPVLLQGLQCHKTPRVHWKTLRFDP
jgi:hypothetical protein